MIFSDEKNVFLTFCRRPLPTAMTVALSTLPMAFSGMCIPPFVVVSLANRSTSTRSNRGIIRLIAAEAYETRNEVNLEKNSLDRSILPFRI